MAPRAVLLLLLLVAAVLGGPAVRRDDQDYDDPAAGGADGGEDAADGKPGAAPPVCPERCHCHHGVKPLRVDCSARKLTAFPDSAEIPENVEVLDLSDNAIRSVPVNLPAEWELLHELSLAGNQITNFPRRALDGLAALEELDLSRNKIASLRHVKPDVFIADINLKVLNLSGNGLQDLGHGSFQSLSSQTLEVLDVSKCAVSSIDGEMALAELPKLRVLRVADNPLQQLPVFSPEGPKLLELDASGCQLRAVPADVLAALPLLQHLAVSRNPDLADFAPPPPPTPRPDDPDQFGHLLKAPAPWSPSLQVLEAEGCALHEATFLAALPNLTEVRLSGNQIALLEAGGLLDNAVLQHLDLADNRLENLPADAFRGTEDRLMELDLSGNRLAALHPDTFAEHKALRSLNVSRNPLVSLQLSAPELRLLDASHAQLQVVAEDVLDGLPQLRSLNVSNNPLPALPARMASPGSVPVLNALDVSLCRLTDFGDAALAGLQELQTLDLRGNRLTDPLKVMAFDGTPQLHALRLGDNPWRCECKTKDFVDMIEFLQKQPAKEDLHSLVCHSPEAVQTKSWYDACLAPGSGTAASLSMWVLLGVMMLGVMAVAAGVEGGRRMWRGKERRQRQRQQQQDEERRACEQEAERRRLHRRMRLQQQEELRRQNMQAQQAASPDAPDPHPPSYEEAMFMDRMTKPDVEERGDSDSDEDEAFHEELQRKVSRLDSSGRATDVIAEEEDEDDEHTALSNGSAGRGNGSTRGTRL